MNSHDATMIILALDTAILEATKAVAQTAADALEYRGYIFTLSEFYRIKTELEAAWPALNAKS